MPSQVLPTTTTATLRTPPYTYLSLAATTHGPTRPSKTIALDEIQLRSYLASALQQQFGLLGAAIAIDILQCSQHEIIIRAPYQDGAAITTALSQWVDMKGKVDVALRVRGQSAWLGGLPEGDGEWEKSLWTLERKA